MKGSKRHFLTLYHRKMKIYGDSISYHSVEKEDTIVYELLCKGRGFYESKQLAVKEEVLLFCKDAYKDNFDSQCYIKRTDKRTIKVCAYQDAQSRGKGVPVISRHVSEKGTRRYYVSSWANFIRDIYPKTRGIHKSFYENIYLDDPCRLYVDIDLDIGDVVPEGYEPNSVSSFERYTEILHNHVMKLVDSLKNFIETVYTGVKMTDVFVLDSSSHSTKKRKFSHHLIFHLDNDTTRFESSADLSSLFGYICQSSFLCELKGVNQTSNPFFWPSDIKTRVIKHENCAESMEIEPEVSIRNRNFIADMSVFGNTSREFRIVGSTKYGENRHFKLIRHCHFSNVDQGSNSSTMKKIDFDNTLTNIDSFGRLLICYVDEKVPVTKLLTFDMTNERSFNSMLVEFKKCDAIEPSGKIGRSPTLAGKKRTNSHDKIVEDDFCGMMDMKNDYERFPASMKKLFCDFSNEAKREYVFDVIAADIVRQNPQLTGETIEWTRYVPRDGSHVVSYRTSSKYCELKGDDHSNNHVFYVTWLKSKCYYQRCWNAECCRSRENTSLVRITGKETKSGDDDDDENSRDGDVDDENKRMDDQSHKFYEEHRHVKSCKSNTRQLSTDTWQLIQDFLHVQTSMVEMYKKFKTGALDDEIKTIAIMDYEALNDVDLSEEEPSIDYSVDRFKYDPILNDLFPNR